MATSAKPEQASPPAPASATLPPIPSAEELAAKVSKLIIKNNGDAAEAIQAVLDDNKNLRDHRRHWEGELAKWNEFLKNTPQGGLQISATDKPLWEKMKELGITKVEDLVTMHTEHGQYKVKQAEDTLAKLHADMAAGKDDKGADLNLDPKLLGELLKLKGMTGEMKDAIIPDPNDKSKTLAIKIPYVKSQANPNAAAEPLMQYVARDLPGFQDALRKAPASEKGDGRGRTTPTRKEVPPQPTTTPKSTGSQGADGSLGAAQRALAGRYGDPFAKPGDKGTT